MADSPFYDPESFNPTAFQSILQPNGNYTFAPTSGSAFANVNNPIDQFPLRSYLDQSGQMDPTTLKRLEEQLSQQNAAKGDPLSMMPVYLALAFAGAAGGGALSGAEGAAGGLSAADLSSLGEMYTGSGAGIGGGSVEMGASSSGGWASDAFNFAPDYNPWGNAINPTEGFSTNPFTNYSSGGLADSISSPGLGGNMATQYSGALAGTGGSTSSFWNDIQNLLKTPTPGSGSVGGTAASGLLNYFIQQQKQQQLQQAANKSAQLNDPMQQPQRLPFQAAYSNLMFDPQSYKQSPYALGQIDLANQAFQANVSKYGPGGTQFSDYLRNVQNVNSADFFKLADQFQVAGGFNQGTGGAGNAYANLAGQAANTGLQSYEGFGNLFGRGGSSSSTGIPSNFDFSKPYTPTENSYGGSFTISQ